TGAESDLQQLTQIARQMVGRWGMSDKVGPVTVLPSDGAGPLLPGASETSPEMQWLVDQEVRRIIDELQADVTELLTDHRDQLERGVRDGPVDPGLERDRRGKRQRRAKYGRRGGRAGERARVERRAADLLADDHDGPGDPRGGREARGGRDRDGFARADRRQ